MESFHYGPTQNYLHEMQELCHPSTMPTAAAPAGSSSRTTTSKRGRGAGSSRSKRSEIRPYGGTTLTPTQPAQVQRRNERERNRVKQVNMGFANLRQYVPNGVRNKKLSKVETLKSAVAYIRGMQKLLNDQGCTSITTPVKEEESDQILPPVSTSGNGRLTETCLTSGNNLLDSARYVCGGSADAGMMHSLPVSPVSDYNEYIFKNEDLTDEIPWYGSQ